MKRTFIGQPTYCTNVVFPKRSVESEKINSYHQSKKTRSKHVKTEEKFGFIFFNNVLLFNCLCFPVNLKHGEQEF